MSRSAVVVPAARTFHGRVENRSGYQERRAMIGSTRMARRAGSQQGFGARQNWYFEQTLS